ncbi:MAG: hypothetical protein U5K81_07175 [Trueperaceae bacterium]|nr:hypothetical protein [Trueperaceae bacterium]
MALVDGLVLLTLSLMLASLIVPERVHGRVQGVVTLLASLLMLLGAIVMILTALGLLILMVMLLAAAPFGTAVYFARYAELPHGDRGHDAGSGPRPVLGYTACRCWRTSGWCRTRGWWRWC